MQAIKKLFPQNIKNLYHLVQAVFANIQYGFPASRRRAVFSASRGGPSKKIKVIGITGTDGKTTTSQMIAKILEESGKKTAMISTVSFSVNGVEEKNLSHYTTESSFVVQKFIKKVIQAGCEYLVLETSSHSLDQHRVWGVEFQTAVITNVTREHLDYHKTMEKYREAKGKLFKKNKKISIVNLDMDNPEYFLNFDADEKYGFTCHPELVLGSRFRTKSGMTSEDVEIIKAENIELGIAGSTYELKAKSYKLNLPGLFNVENALAATCVGLSEGIDLETIKEALAKIKGVAGRMERVENDLGIHILVDFALTPNALKRLYETLFQAKEPDAKIIAVFGSCGDRDKGKRPIMGEVVSKYSDVIILTNDEPYHENPQTIIDEISAGVKNKTAENLLTVIDRREAIQKALKIAKAGDIIAITGMGNFESMVVGNKKIPWNDRKVVEDELAKM